MPNRAPATAMISKTRPNPIFKPKSRNTASPVSPTAPRSMVVISGCQSAIQPSVFLPISANDRCKANQTVRFNITPTTQAVTTANAFRIFGWLGRRSMKCLPRELYVYLRQNLRHHARRQFGAIGRSHQSAQLRGTYFVVRWHIASSVILLRLDTKPGPKPHGALAHPLGFYSGI